VSGCRDWKTSGSHSRWSGLAICHVDACGHNAQHRPRPAAGAAVEDAISARREDAAAILRETRNQYREGTALNNLGIAYREMRQPDEAAASWREAAAALCDWSNGAPQ
jgi:hypothetical protein